MITDVTCYNTWYTIVDWTLVFMLSSKVAEGDFSLVGLCISLYILNSASLLVKI